MNVQFWATISWVFWLLMPVWLVGLYVFSSARSNSTKPTGLRLALVALFIWAIFLDMLVVISAMATGPSETAKLILRTIHNEYVIAAMVGVIVGALLATFEVFKTSDSPNDSSEVFGLTVAFAIAFPIAYWILQLMVELVSKLVAFTV